MTSRSKHPKNNKQSIRYWWIPSDLQHFDPVTGIANEDSHQHSKSHRKNGKHAETTSSSSGVSTSQFVSALVGLWDFVGQPPEQRTRDGLNYGEVQQKEKSPKLGPTISVDDKVCSSSSAKSDFGTLKEIKRSFLHGTRDRNIGKYSILSDLWPCLDVCRYDKTVTTRVPYELACDNGNINLTLNSHRSDFHVANESSITKGKCSPVCQSSIQSQKRNVTSEGKESFVDTNVNRKEHVVLLPPKTLCEAYLLQPITTMEETVVELTSSTLRLDYNIGAVTALVHSQQSTDSRCVAVEVFNSIQELEEDKSQKIPEDRNFHENCKSSIVEEYEEDNFSNHWLSLKDKLQHVFVKNKHAMSGALAGTMVSLCLHPVDTVKTIIQANASSHLSSYLILKTVVSEKGVSGLYRGISSNIASSAPTSAIYTYTYESVKGALLPVFPKEYHSVAHCTAGGCSSIATSFVFTPSERIKQQMQVGIPYRNSWSALIGCLQKGGISSLYAGWGAVLCRNIPHSVIKFYTYENLKRYLLTSENPDARPGTVQTLVCGGIAASTAALFTTPFDVVKTRLQTQVPGSLAKYDGVLHALQSIARREGLQGLYRGLTPRLAMYVSQGGIFFASYEFLKSIFSLEAPQSVKIC